MKIVLANTSNKPIYQQIFDQISSQIIKGEMVNGDSLPSIRTAAKELRVSIITVKKAWEELERHGFIYTQAGRGCFVAELGKASIEEKRADLAETKFAKNMIYYKELGYSIEEIIELVKKYY